jgi:post-segregation antitoxin (ccd killing protein)
VRYLVRSLLSYFPTSLPKGRAAFNAWADEIIWLAGKSVPNNDSTHFTLAAMVMRLKETADRLPKRRFAKALRRACSGEVACAIMGELKEKQKAAWAAENAAAAATQQVPTPPTGAVTAATTEKPSEATPATTPVVPGGAEPVSN